MKPSHIHLPADCRAVGDVLARVGDKWSVLVVTRLGDGPMRFNELRRTIGGISQRMLTLTLRGLERDLLNPVSALGTWAIRNQTKIARARAEFDGNCAANGKRPLKRRSPRAGLVQAAPGT